MAEVILFDRLKNLRMEREVYARWMSFYKSQPYEEVLEALVHEHENDFPLRRSENLMDQQRHKALVAILDEKAQTQFLKSFLDEIRVSRDFV